MLLPLPDVEITASTDKPYPGDDEEYLLASPDIGKETYKWSAFGNDSLRSVDFLTSYRVTWKYPAEELSSGITVMATDNETGCVGYDTFFVSIYKPVPIEVTNIVNTRVSCYGDEDGSLQFTIENTELPFEYKIEYAATGQVLENQTINQSGVYTTGLLENLSAGYYRVHGTDGRDRTFNETFEVLSPDPLDVSLSDLDVDCSGEDTFLSPEVSGGTQPYHYVWSDGSVNEQLSVASSGTYALTVTDSSGCIDSDNAQVDMPAPITVNVEIEQPYCDKDNRGSILLEGDGGLGGFTYQWNTGDEGSKLNGLEVGEYHYTVTDAAGCNYFDTVDLQPLNESCIDIPNAFSPNADGVNDQWEIDGLNRYYPNAVIDIYDRDGRLIYSSGNDGYNHPWDGSYGGVAMPIATYFYVITLDKNEPSLTGNILIIR